MKEGERGDDNHLKDYAIQAHNQLQLLQLAGLSVSDEMYSIQLSVFKV